MLVAVGRAVYFCVACQFLASDLVLLTPHALAADPTAGVADREVLVTVKGVATPFSVFGLIERFGQIPGVERVSFDLSQGLADVILKPGAQVTDEDFRRAVRSASYTPGDISRKPGPPVADHAQPDAAAVK